VRGGNHDGDGCVGDSQVRTVLPGGDGGRRRQGRPQAVQRVRVRTHHPPARPGAGQRQAHLRDTIELWDLPITKGLQERIHEFERLDRDIRLEPFLAALVALGRAFKIVDSKLVNPSNEHWERSFALFELLL
jgi:hypothetical protein